MEFREFQMHSNGMVLKYSGFNRTQLKRRFDTGEFSYMMIVIDTQGNIN